jgi:hypothetical protein
VQSRYAAIGFGSCTGRIEPADIAKLPDIETTALKPGILIRSVEMECRASLVHAHLVLPGLDPDEVLHGQLLTVLTALLGLLALHLLGTLAQAVL